MPTKLSEPYSRDTTPEAQRLLNNIVREMPQLKRAQRFFAINRFVREMAIAGHQARDTTLTQREAQLLLIRDLLGDEDFSRVYGAKRHGRTRAVSQDRS